MKTIRSWMTLVGLFVMFFTLGTAGANGQVLDTVRFSGTFTLPFDAQWGKMTLPAGDYTLRYGRYYEALLVEVLSTKAGGLHGVILVEGSSRSSARKSALVCVREGNALIVRALEMPNIGTAAGFRLPRGTQLTAQKGNHNGYTQLAEGPMLIERIPVAMNGR